MLKALAAVLASALLVAGCASPFPAPASRPSLSSSPSPARSPAQPVKVAAATACTGQASAWKLGAGGRALAGVDQAIQPFTTGKTTGVQASRVIAAVFTARQSLIPVCADPRHFYSKFLAGLDAAVAAAATYGPATAIRPLDQALTALRRLQAEVRRTAGLSLRTAR